MSVLPLDLSSLIGKVSDRELKILSRDNPDARLETNSFGELIVLPPTDGKTGIRNGELCFQIGIWNRQTKLGVVFGSSVGFKLSNGAIRSPDVSWIPIKTWNALTKEQKKTFSPINPDFVLELMSFTDVLEQVQSKMREYMNCGSKLGWLINPHDKQVEIYRQGKKKEILNNPQTLSGEDIMTGLVVDLAEIFD